MIIKHEDHRRDVAVVDIKAFVPRNHLLRKIDRCIDWNKIYEFVEDLYAPIWAGPASQYPCEYLFKDLAAESMFQSNANRKNNCTRKSTKTGKSMGNRPLMRVPAKRKNGGRLRYPQPIQKADFS
jgi:hypothetical protein